MRSVNRSDRSARSARPGLRRLRALATGVAAVLAALTASPAAASGARQPDDGPAAVTAVRGGDTLYGADGSVCTVAFNARSDSTYYALMPGHCAGPGTTWYADPSRTVVVGTTIGAHFPADDYGLLRYTGTAVTHPGEVTLRDGTVRDITGAAFPVVGQSLCHLGRVTGIHCGTVSAVNVSVNYPEGTVTGLFRSTICSEPGDVGGPAFSGTTALGFIVSGSGNCRTGGSTFYQPVAEILAAYGLTLY
ncbi:S1 family peptidase [Streptomyces pactum]|uniref:S1 family peptidase n=1 Tax=Streptomyces pactum TaxID=68249 RepID=UPI0036FE9181